MANVVDSERRLQAVFRVAYARGHLNPGIEDESCDGWVASARHAFREFAYTGQIREIEGLELDVGMAG